MQLRTHPPPGFVHLMSTLLPLLLSPHPSYSFLYDEKMPEEREELRAALKKTKGQAARTELQVGDRRCAH